MIVAGKLMAPVRIDFTYKKAVIVITIICIVIRHIIVITMTAFFVFEGLLLHFVFKVLTHFLLTFYKL